MSTRNSMQRQLPSGYFPRASVDIGRTFCFGYVISETSSYLIYHWHCTKPAIFNRKYSYILLKMLQVIKVIVCNIKRPRQKWYKDGGNPLWNCQTCLTKLSMDLAEKVVEGVLSCVLLILPTYVDKQFLQDDSLIPTELSNMSTNNTSLRGNEPNCVICCTCDAMSNYNVILSWWRTFGSIATLWHKWTNLKISIVYRCVENT